MESVQDILNSKDLNLADLNLTEGGDPQQLAQSLLSGISLSWIVAGLVFSTLGLIVFRRAKQRSNIVGMVIGVALIVYAYFVTDPMVAWVVGALLTGLAYITRYS